MRRAMGHNICHTITEILHSTILGACHGEQPRMPMGHDGRCVSWDIPWNAPLKITAYPLVYVIQWGHDICHGLSQWYIQWGSYSHWADHGMTNDVLAYGTVQAMV